MLGERRCRISMMRHDLIAGANTVIECFFDGCRLLGTLLLRLPTHIERLALRKGREVTDKLRQLLAAVSRRFSLKSACYAVPELVFQCDHLVRLWIEARIDRRCVRKARNCSTIGQCSESHPTINVARLTGLAIATEGFMNKESFPILDGLFQLRLIGGSLRSA